MDFRLVDPLTLSFNLFNRVSIHLENLEKSGNFTLREKSAKLCFACDVLPQLR